MKQKFRTSSPRRVSLEREARFLPKKLVAVILICASIYFWTVWQNQSEIERQTPTFMGASIQSILTADYRLDTGRRPLFAPLDWKLVEDKLRDENPYLSKSEVDTLLQNAHEVLSDPILKVTAASLDRVVTATPTNAPYTVLPLSSGEKISNSVEATISLTTRSTIVSLSPSATVALPTLVTGVATISSTFGEETPTPTFYAPPSPHQPAPPSTATPTATPESPIALPTSSPTITTAPTSTPVSTFPPSPTMTPSTTATANTTLSLTVTATLTPITIATATNTDTWTPTTTATPTALIIPVPTNTTTPTPSPTNTLPPTEPLFQSQTPPPQTSTWTPASTPTTTPTLPPTSSPTATASAAPISTATSTATVTPSFTTTPTTTSTETPTASLTPTPEIAATRVLDPPLSLGSGKLADKEMVVLIWSPVVHAIGYNVYRSLTPPVDTQAPPLNADHPLTQTTYIDRIVLNGATYYYVVTAVDDAGNESAPSPEVNVPTEPSSP